MKPKPSFRMTGAEILTGLGSGHFAYPLLPTLPPGRPRPQLRVASAGIAMFCKVARSGRQLGAWASVYLADWLAAV